MPEDRVMIRVSESIEIARPPEAVWDFTQDFSRRADWDVGIRSAQLIAEEPRRAHLELAGLGPVTAEYRLFRRPERTSRSLRMKLPCRVELPTTVTTRAPKRQTRYSSVERRTKSSA